MLTDRLRRILYRASRRSKLEAEELLGPFAEQMLREMSEEELAELELLLELDDISILETFAGKKSPPEGLEGMFRKLREFWKGSKQLG